MNITTWCFQLRTCNSTKGFVRLFVHQSASPLISPPFVRHRKWEKQQRYDFSKIYLQLQIDFFFQFFFILCRINTRVCLSLFEQANTRKHIFKHSCSSVRVISSILAHLAQSFFFWFQIKKISKNIDKCFNKQIQESISMSRAAHLWGCF